MAINIPDHEWNKLREAIEVLAGWRGAKDKPGKAVTAADIRSMRSAIENVETAMKSISKVTLDAITSADAAGAAPTSPEHNALRADMVAIHEAVTAIKSALTR